jgi:hypothetical protein
MSSACDSDQPATIDGVVDSFVRKLDAIECPASQIKITTLFSGAGARVDLPISDICLELNTTTRSDRSYYHIDVHSQLTTAALDRLGVLPAFTTKNTHAARLADQGGSIDIVAIGGNLANQVAQLHETVQFYNSPEGAVELAHITAKLDAVDRLVMGPIGQLLSELCANDTLQCSMASTTVLFTPVGDADPELVNRLLDRLKRRLLADVQAVAAMHQLIATTRSPHQLPASWLDRVVGRHPGNFVVAPLVNFRVPGRANTLASWLASRVHQRWAEALF